MIDYTTCIHHKHCVEHACIDCEKCYIYTPAGISLMAMQKELDCINFADCCDAASSTQLRLRNAIKTVIEWSQSPAYRERVRWCQNRGFLDAPRYGEYGKEPKT